MNSTKKEEHKPNKPKTVTAPRLDLRALHTDQTAAYVIPQESGKDGSLRIRLRTGRSDVDDCLLIENGNRIRMKRTRSTAHFDYYSAGFQTRKGPVKYMFELVMGSRHVFYTARGLKEEAEQEDCWVFSPDFHIPHWLKGAVMYQIFVDRFCNGDPSNDVLTGEYAYLGDRVERVEDWEELPRPYDVLRHYGGDLQGVIDKLDYLRDLGIEAIYLNPIFLSPSNHKYDTQDYDHVDPHFGRIVRKTYPQSSVLPEGEKDNRRSPVYLERVLSPENLEAGDRLFAELVRQAHARGIRVILDGVFNHCGSFHRWMDRERIYENRKAHAPGAFLRENSPFHDYFTFPGKYWPAHAEYESWWGFDSLPKLNYEGSKRLQEEILRIAAKWVSPPYGADGWRLDVAADLGHSERFNHLFWRQFRKTVKKANPEAVIIAEHYGNPAAWLQGDQWDTIMNYDYFMEPVSWFLTGMEKHSDYYDAERRNDPEAFWAAMDRIGEGMPRLPFLCSMNQLSNHDHSRFLTRTSGRTGRLTQEKGAPNWADAAKGVSKAVMREAVLMQMTWPGAPTVYYGDEAGLCGFTDPDNRRPYPWGKEDKGMLEFTRSAIMMRRGSTALRRGSLVRLADHGGFLSYGRFDRRESVVVLINNEDSRVECEVPVFYANVPDEAEMEMLLGTDARGMTGGRTLPVHGGILKVQMPATAGMVLCWKRDRQETE